MLWIEKERARSSHYQGQDNHPIVLDSNYLLQQKIDYIHYNLVAAGFVEKPGDYLYRSAKKLLWRDGVD
ncbi:MAG: hypothetical protein ABI723_26030 [Bacteroidia bacterium]